MILGSRIAKDKLDDGVWILTLSGKHDRTTSPQVSAELDALLAVASARVVVSLAQTTFLDSGILAVLVQAAECDPGRVVVVAPPRSPAARLFDLTGAERVLTTFTTITEAITWCRRADARPGDKVSSRLGLPTTQPAAGHPTPHRTMEEAR
ncbi:MAG TPA: STAS domain-containing protein [Gaiellales bacterium]|jgi:anti-sigma B factor antagonist|nr:STAS domain-containing protein [Gaiellales bacterium]